MTPLPARSLIAGTAQGPLLWSDTGLSFWGGVDAASGEVIDRHHPLSGQCLAGRVLAIPSGRGSCSGSGVLLELLLNGHAPAALLLAEADEILTLGALVAQQLFGHSLPVLCLSATDFAALRELDAVHVGAAGVSALAQAAGHDAAPAAAEPGADLWLSAFDRALLAGEHGRAAQAAMRIVLQMAALQGAHELIDVQQAHIDGCIYTGPASLRFARRLLDWGARVRVPTTLNAISVDQRRWRALGVDPAFGEPASALGEVYCAMGAQPSFTCAPYLLDSAPACGEQIAWAESNAVVYANSVLGARTLKYPDFLDICIALTGRAPLCGSHGDAGRRARVRIDVERPAAIDDAFYPLLGYHVGQLCGSAIPLLCGLQQAAPDRDALKAFGAAFATTSAAPMFHILGVTPEAASVEQALGGASAQRHLSLRTVDLRASWAELDRATDSAVQLVALGNPHCSLSECARLAALCQGRRRHADTAVIVTLGRAVFEQATRAGYVATLQAFGVQFVTDTCWCMLGEPVLPPATRTLMTNSAKYAHYAPGLSGRAVHFGSLAACIDTACRGHCQAHRPPWLDA